MEVQQVQPAKLYAAFTDTEADAFRVALAEQIGDAEAAKLSWQRRGALAADGSFMLGYNTPLVSSLRLGHYGDVPWNYPNGSRKAPPGHALVTGEGMMNVPKFETIPVAVAVLRSADNPEIECVRRERLFKEALQTERERVEANAKTETEERVSRAAYLRQRPERWAALPRDIKALYVAAAHASLQGISPSQTFVRLAELLRGSDVALAAPPLTFEPAEGR